MGAGVRIVGAAGGDDMGVEESALLGLVRGVDERLQRYADEVDFRNAGAYIERAQAKFAVGFPLLEVIDDLWMASRCLEGRASLHFLKHPIEKLRVRRIDPLEVSLLGGQASIMSAAAESYAFPIMPVLARTATQEIRNEAAHISSFFSTERLDGLRDLIGLAAAVYSAALGAIIRGQDDEAGLSLDLLDNAAQAAGVTGGPDEPAPLIRYLRLARALRLLLDANGPDANGLDANGAELPAVLGAIITGHQQTLRNAAQDDPDRWRHPPSAAAYLDTSSASLIGLAILKAVPFDADRLPADAGAYRDLYVELGRVDRSSDEQDRADAAKAEYEKAVDGLEAAGLVTRTTAAGPRGSAPEASAPGGLTVAPPGLIGPSAPSAPGPPDRSDPSSPKPEDIGERG